MPPSQTIAVTGVVLSDASGDPVDKGPVDKGPVDKGPVDNRSGWRLYRTIANTSPELRMISFSSSIVTSAPE